MLPMNVTCSQFSANNSNDKLQIVTCSLGIANYILQIITLQIIRIQGTKSVMCYNSMVIKEITIREFHIARIVAW